jgi:hypothetical protein
MKINLPASLIAAMMIESPSYREYLSERLAYKFSPKSPEEKLKEKVKALILSCGTNKIQAIKEVRSLFPTCEKLFCRAFGVTPCLYPDQGPTLSLYDAKQIVESFK